MTTELRLIKFTCYEYNYSDGVTTLFLFYPDGVWDEDKLSLSDALNNYPISEYEWVHFNSTSKDELRLELLEKLLDVYADGGGWGDTVEVINEVIK